MTAPAPTAPAAGFQFLGLRGWSRQEVVITTESLADDATESASVTVAPAWRLYKVVFSAAARLRLYASTTQRTADLSRAIGTDPDLTADHGLLFEFVADPSLLTAVLSPLVDGYCPSGTQVPYALTNLSGSTAAIQATMTLVRTE